ncbi:MAG: homoserine kinase [Betaproteobacteria bacterium]|nr:MAG: homoserine kinase [Betaproteobacteria bacterium]
MSVYTTVTADDLRRWLQDYAVGELIELRGIPTGIENTNYFVTTSGGHYVLTLFEKLTAQELPFYLNLMAHLAEQGVPSAHPVANSAGSYLGTLNGKPAALVARLEGKDVDTPTIPQCAAVGAVLARLHRAGQSYRSTMDNPRGPKWWKAVLPDVLPFLPQAEGALLQEEVRFQSLYRFSDLPRGAIHADLFRDNVLFAGDRVAGVIDFYFACTDVLLYDIAIAVNDWCISADGALDTARTRAFLDAYAAVRPYTPIERGAWPVMLRAGALRFWVSRLYDFHLPRPGELTHAKDPGHFRRILELRIRDEHALPGLTG